MKKLVFGLIATVMLSFSSFAQESVFKGKNTIIKTTIIESNINSIIMKVDITNSETNVTLPSFFYKFQSDSKSNLIEDLKKDPKAVSGTYTVIVDSELVYIRKVINGNFTEGQTFDFEGTSVLGKKYPCTIKGQFQCVDDRINDMNWIDYGACLLTAPACYGQLHASCAWDNCN